MTNKLSYINVDLDDTTIIVIYFIIGLYIGFKTYNEFVDMFNEKGFDGVERVISTKTLTILTFFCALFVGMLWPIALIESLVLKFLGKSDNDDIDDGNENNTPILN